MKLFTRHLTMRAVSVTVASLSKKQVRVAGFAPAAFWSQIRRSPELNYTRIKKTAETACVVKLPKFASTIAGFCSCVASHEHKGHSLHASLRFRWPSASATTLWVYRPLLSAVHTEPHPYHYSSLPSRPCGTLSPGDQSHVCAAARCEHN